MIKYEVNFFLSIEQLQYILTKTVRSLDHSFFQEHNVNDAYIQFKLDCKSANVTEFYF
jgi:hypothetical protein